MLLVIPVVLGGVTVLFLLFFVIPGDPASLIAAGNGKVVPPAVRENVDKKYDLDKPLYVQYGHYLNRLAHGDLGSSYQSGETVNHIMKRTAPASLRLAIWAVILETAFGITAGVISAVRKYSILDSITTVTTTMALAIPVFVLGYVLQWIFGIQANAHSWPQFFRLPVSGIGPDTWTLGILPTGDQWRYLVLPAVTLACVSTAVVARIARTTMIEVEGAEYMRTARAKGLAEHTVTLKHGLRNALIPVITLIGLDLGALMGSAVVTEVVFSWPGMGSKIASAAAGKDAPVVLGLTLVLIVVYVVMNLLVDLSYGVFDPRIRYGKEAN